MYSAVAANKRNTILIMLVFIGLVAGIGYGFSLYYGNNPYIFYGTVIGAGVYALIQYFAAAKLATMSSGAHEIQKSDDPRFWRTVENICITEGLPMPKVYIIEDEAPNAFATGRDPKHAIVCATTGLLQIMDDSELEAVMAHEIGHIKNYDIRVMMIVFGLVSVIGLLSDIFLRMMWFSGGQRNNNNNSSPIFLIFGIVAAILAPIIATLIQLAISRQREYLADATSVQITRYPDAMIRALKKLMNYSRPMKRASQSTAHLFFANPLKAGFFSKLFSTHPPLEERIARLEKMSTKM